MLDFYHIIEIYQLDYYHPERTLETLRHHVNQKIARLQKRFPEGRQTYKPLCAELLRLGVTPQTTYLYMRGHDLFKGLVAPMLNGVCEVLRREKENEIRRLAVHSVQAQNELASYQHSIGLVEEMLRKHTTYTDCPEYQRVQADIKAFLNQSEHTESRE